MTQSDLDYLDIVYQGKDMILDAGIAKDLIKRICEVHGKETAYTGLSTVYQLAGKEYLVSSKHTIKDCEYTHEQVYEAMMKLSYKYSPAIFKKLTKTYRGSFILHTKPGLIQSYYRDIA